MARPDSAEGAIMKKYICDKQTCKRKCSHRLPHYKNFQCSYYCPKGKSQKCIPYKLIHGRDFDGWAWKYHDKTNFSEFTFDRPRTLKNIFGNWVKVKLVEVKCAY